VKIQGESQVLDRPVVDAGGRGLGRVIAVKCAPEDPYTVEWFVLRLRGWRRGRRAVPAARADWRAGGGLRVSFARDVVLASPALPSPGLDSAGSRAAVQAFYAPVSAARAPRSLIPIGVEPLRGRRADRSAE